MKKIVLIFSYILLIVLIAIKIEVLGKSSFSIPSTIGGSNGKIIKVSNLNSSGVGSLKDALETKGPRVVVFEVAGVIDLNGTSLKIDEPFLTLAGESAPSPGVTLIKGGISIYTHDVHISHLKIRPGDFGQKKRSGWQPDGVNIFGSQSYNIVIEHCSISWAIDENLSASGPNFGRSSHDILFKYNIISEGLYKSSHEKGPHSMGSLIHNNVKNVLIIGNLYAHNNQRNPRFKQGATGVVANNIIYNPGTSIIKLGPANNDFIESGYLTILPRVSVIGNVLIPGIDTTKNIMFLEGRGVVYKKDNLIVNNKNPIKYSDKHIATATDLNISKDNFFSTEYLDVFPAREAFFSILNHVGSRPWDIDETDMRIFKSLCDGSGHIIDTQDEVGGYPKVDSRFRSLDLPPNEINFWLSSFRKQKTIRNFKHINCKYPKL